MLGIFAGLLLGVLYAFARDFLDDTIKNEEDVRRFVSIPILGQIPHISGEPDSILPIFDKPKSVLIESLRTLRTNLRYMSAVKGAEVIALTSTIGSEGKTTVAINLAAIMSMAGKRTIMINTDMRRPKLAEILGQPNDKGMSSILSGGASLDEVVQPTAYDNFFIISSGPIPPNPAELIEKGNLEDIISQLKQNFDIIIMDTPPIGLVADAMSMLHIADITLYLLRANYSKRTFLTGIQRLKEENALDNLGIVINDIDYGLVHGYGYGYGYGSKGYGYYDN